MSKWASSPNTKPNTGARACLWKRPHQVTPSRNPIPKEHLLHKPSETHVSSDRCCSKTHVFFVLSFCHLASDGHPPKHGFSNCRITRTTWNKPTFVVIAVSLNKTYCVQLESRDFLHPLPASLEQRPSRPSPRPKAACSSWRCRRDGCVPPLGSVRSHTRPKLEAESPSRQTSLM